MKRPRISFEATGWQRLLGRGQALERYGFFTALLLSLALLFWVVWLSRALGQEVEGLRADLRKVQAPTSRPVQLPPAPVAPAETLRQMDAATARLNVPWSDVLDAIERSASPRVALLALEPDARTGSVALTAEARSLEDLLSHADAIGHDAAIASVRMGQHDLRVQEPGQPVRLTLSISPAPLRP